MVGISDYESYPTKTSWSNINGVNDALLLASDLKEEGFLVTTLLDSEAMYENIGQALTQLIAEAEEGDLIYFHFSGHGQPVLDRNGDEGIEDGWDESIVPIDAGMFYEKGKYEGEKHIIDDELGDYLNLIRKKVGQSGMVYAVLDACYSGTATRGEEEEVKDLEGAVDRDAPLRGVDVGFDFGEFVWYEPMVVRTPHYTLESLPGYSHLIVLEACLPHQKNREIWVDERYYGPLSYAIHKTLKVNKISKQTSWIGDVLQFFEADKRNIRQKVVCESTIENEKGY
ncbi:MAG: caspase family protein [Phocaeicola sp.]